MSLVITPGQFADRAQLYHQLSQLTNAGIGLPQAIQAQFRAPPSRSYRKPLAQLIEKIQQGHTFAESVMSLGHWMPSFDAALLAAGEKSGRLPSSFKLLAGYYQERAQLARQVIGGLAYPLFLFHFAILLGPLPALVTSANFIAYFQTVGIVLIPLYGFVFLLVFASQGKHGENWRSFIERITNAIPLLGKARRNLALARLSAALEALINAGVPIIEAWELSAAACGSPALKRAVFSWKPSLESGITPAEMVVSSGKFPDLFSNLYNSGEITGKLDEELGHLNKLFHEESTRQLGALARWVPLCIYLGIVGLIAYRIVSFYAGHYGQLEQILGE